MSRLFITPREIDFISDVTKEVIKDVIGQVIYYFSINVTKTSVDDLYYESPEKIFDTPVQLEALVDYQPADTKTDTFGFETQFTIKVYVHARDLIDKKIQLAAGDFFSYGDVFFEVVKFVTTDNIYGQIEHEVGFEIIGKEARKSQFISKIFGPTSESKSDSDAVQETFVQQRGQATNRLGETNDIRELQKRNVLETPLSGPREISPKGKNDCTDANSAFYDDE